MKRRVFPVAPENTFVSPHGQFIVIANNLSHTITAFVAIDKEQVQAKQSLN